MPQTQIETLQNKVISLQRQLETHRVCPVYGILTRTAIEEIWEQQKRVPDLAISFLDIDDLKQKNLELGQDEANRRISQAFSLARRGEVTSVMARFFSGDEFVILTPKSNIFAACDRVMAALNSHGMSATAAIVLYEGQESLADAVREAGELVTQCKAIAKGKAYSFLPN